MLIFCRFSICEHFPNSQIQLKVLLRSQSWCEDAKLEVNGAHSWLCNLPFPKQSTLVKFGVQKTNTKLQSFSKHHMTRIIKSVLISIDKNEREKEKTVVLFGLRKGKRHSKSTFPFPPPSSVSSSTDVYFQQKILVFSSLLLHAVLSIPEEFAWKPWSCWCNMWPVLFASR